MRITVFGAAGNVGRRVVAEALARDHEVTAVVRDPARFQDLPAGAEPRVGDAGNADEVARLSAGRDVVIAATRPPPGHEDDFVAMTEALLAGVARAGVRILVVGGAGSLAVPGKDGIAVVDDPELVAPAWRAIALAGIEQLETCRADTAADWTYLSPPAVLKPGRRTGTYRLGTDELLIDGEGRSIISLEDLAVVLLDEAEFPRHRRARFTAGY